jgi:hypothetical protein
MSAQPTLSPVLAQQAHILLTDMHAHFSAQLDLLARHREALSSADSAALARCVAQQQDSALKLSELEHRRSVLVRAALGARATRATTLSQIVQLAPAEVRAGLLERASRVRELIARCEQRQGALAQASGALLAHVRGIVQQIAHKLSDTGTYAPRTLPGATPAGALDLVS